MSITELSRQLAASFEMLTTAVKTANHPVWTDGTPPFWQIGFHITNSVDFYFSTFDPEIDNPNEQYVLPEEMRLHAYKGHFDQHPEVIVTQKELVNYISTTRDRIRGHFTRLQSQLDEPSGFEWLPMNKYELILYNIRHIMEHVAILNQYLKRHDLPAAGWVGIAEL